MINQGDAKNTKSKSVVIILSSGTLAGPLSLAGQRLAESSNRDRWMFHRPCPRPPHPRDKVHPISLLLLRLNFFYHNVSILTSSASSPSSSAPILKMSVICFVITSNKGE